MDVNPVLVDILVVLLAAKAAAEVAERARLPTVVGEIVAGVLVGPSLLGVVEPNEVLRTLGELGVVLLMLQVGLETDLRELASVGRAALLVAVIGVAAPFALGAGAGVALGMKGGEALFVGAALTATSVGITARVFSDLRALTGVEARTVLGAAITDDVIGLVILGVVGRLATGASVSPWAVAEVVAVGAGFVVLATGAGARVAPALFNVVRRHSRSAGTLVAVTLAFALALAELAHTAGLAPIVGAFVAGLVLARTGGAERTRRELVPVGHLLVPVFFLQIGIDADVTQLARPSVLVLGGVLLVAAVAGKIVSSSGMTGMPGDRLLVGLGMIPRGEVGLIFATLGLREHVFGSDVYAALLLVVLATTVLTPPVLRWRLLRVRAGSAAAVAPDAVARHAGAAWVAIAADGRVTLAEEPPASRALEVALTAARLCETQPPAPPLLDWLAAFPAGPRRWDGGARWALRRLLEEGGARSWRLLSVSGVLERALPELADAIAAREAHDALLDPLAAFRFPRLDDLRERSAVTTVAYPHSDALLLAALVIDACEESSASAEAVTRRTAVRLGMGADLEDAAASLVAERGLLAAAAQRADAFEEEHVLQLAAHLGSAARASALYLLTLAAWEGETWERDRVDTLHDLLQAALACPELTGLSAEDEVDRRRHEAVACIDDARVRARVESAPRAYVLQQRPADVARHAMCCEPRPVRDELRVRVDPYAGGWEVIVVGRDRVGLLAREAAALTESGASVRSAVAVTWGDGVALAAYRLGPGTRPDAPALATRLRALLGVPLATRPAPDVHLVFDDDGSPWHTRCIVEGADRPGLLHTLATAFASTGASVHAARVTTERSRVLDAFELSGPDGGKLDERRKAQIRAALEQGVVPRAARRWLRSRQRAVSATARSG